MRRPAQIVSALVPLVLIAAAVWLAVRPAPDAHRPPPPPARKADGPGVALASIGHLPVFEKATGDAPAYVCVYFGFGKPFPRGAVDAIARHGALPLIDLNPGRVRLAAIAAGRYDSYLRAYAKAAAAFGDRLAISFGHEMNGNWFSWGYRHTPPGVFTAAWRHIVTVFRSQGAQNVTWVWTVNIVRPHNPATSAAAPWWPGSRYVTWVGIDGYFRYPTDSFTTVFSGTIAQVRKITGKPILITETGVGPGPEAAAQVAELFTGIRFYGLLGFIWFDATGQRDWRIERDPPVLAAFRMQIKEFPQ
jgi:hypothetical protein